MRDAEQREQLARVSSRIEHAVLEYVRRCPIGGECVSNRAQARYQRLAVPEPTQAELFG